eukprot:74794-Rhodomonas_salina.1
MCFCGAAYTDTASNSEPFVERTALAVLSANIQLALVPVQRQEDCVIGCLASSACATSLAKSQESILPIVTYAGLPDIDIASSDAVIESTSSLSHPNSADSRVSA